MLGPSYGAWWQERPAGQRLRVALVLFPVLSLAGWVVLSRPAAEARVPEMFSAAASGDTALVAELLAAGVPASPGTDGDTPLLRAVRNRHATTARLLIEHGADVDRPDHDGISALHIAAQAGDIGSVEVLLAGGADVRIASPRYGTALHRAALQGHAAVARLLLRHGADVDARDARRLTPLHYAVRAGRDGLAQLLLAAHADIDARADDGRSLLHWAAATGRPDILGSLLLRGAATTSMDTYGNSPLHLAARRNDLRSASLLLAAGADIDARTLFLETTPLHLAVRTGHLEMTRLLLDAGANTRAPNPIYGTPAELALQAGRPELARLLRTVAGDRRRTSRAAPEPPAPVQAAAPACTLPARLHPASRKFLDAWTDGDLSVAAFRRGFSLPQSSYLPLGECLAALYAGE